MHKSLNQVSKCHMKKVLLTKVQYTFCPAIKKVVLKDYIDSFNKENLLLITNVTDNIIINTLSCAVQGETIQNDYITLEFNTKQYHQQMIYRYIIKFLNDKPGYLKYGKQKQVNMLYFNPEDIIKA